MIRTAMKINKVKQDMYKIYFASQGERSAFFKWIKEAKIKPKWPVIEDGHYYARLSNSDVVYIAERFTGGVIGSWGNQPKPRNTASLLRSIVFDPWYPEIGEYVYLDIGGDHFEKGFVVAIYEDDCVEVVFADSSKGICDAIIAPIQYCVPIEQ